mmetsp:Transcript_31253/g.73618  ORF Transcript_31253/g.73618 Transcript_31253/m.73618 type:complete len:434 (-) Transcript_31253:135-1436(-)
MRAFKSRKVPKFYRETVNQKRSKKDDGSISQIKLFFFMAIAALCVGIWNQRDLGFDLTKEEISIFPSAKTWCEQVKEARDDLTMTHLRVSYPCEGMKPAKSAIVCMLTDGSTEEKANRIVFTARDYINGAMSLGASLHGNIDPSQTHQLLLLREGFELDKDDIIRLESVGWTIGTAPNFPLEQKYLPTFPRYKTTYTKVTAIGLSEYKCVMLMDADTLAIGDLREVMKCDTTFLHPSNRVGGTLDWYRGKWLNYNTGSILWKTSAKEMERVFELTKDSSFMKRYGSDQDFLNNVYPDRINNRTLNNEVMALDTAESRKVGNALVPVIPHSAARSSSVAPLSWDYNAQTHAEVQNWDFWNSHRSTVRILHFTEKKGWQCDRSTDEPPPPEEMPEKCDKNIPICFCREAHLYWRALEKAEKLAEVALASYANNKA